MGEPGDDFAEPGGLVECLDSSCELLRQRGRCVGLDRPQVLRRRRIFCLGPPPPERRQVLLDRHAVEFDGLFERVGRDGNGPRLDRHADDERVRHHRITEQRRGDRLGIGPEVGGGVGLGPDDLDQLLGCRQVQFGVQNHLAGRGRCRRTHHHGVPGLADVERTIGRRNQLVAGEQEIGLLSPQSVRRIGADPRQADVAHHRAGLLRQPDLIEAGDRVAVEHPGGADDLRHRHDARAADTGDPHGEMVGRHRDGRVGNLGRCEAVDDALARVLVEFDGHERRAVALEAGEVEVAGRLVDRGLASERGLERLDREAVAHLSAVAAALADARVDHDPLGRSDHSASLAITT